jgi:hypothetical protein
MALTKCKECGNEVSTTAKTCPKCGAKAPKKMGLFAKIALGFIGLTFVMAFFGSRDRAPVAPATPSATSAPASAKASPQADEAAAKEKKNSDRAWRAVAAMATIKQGLRNPASVQWGEIRADETGNTVCIEYRAQNGFGGLNLERATAIGPSLSTRVEDWNNHCVQSLYVVSQAEQLLEFYERRQH